LKITVIWGKIAIRRQNILFPSLKPLFTDYTHPQKHKPFKKPLYIPLSK